MFYDNLKAICDKNNIKITPLVLECGGTKGVISGWKRGAAPNSDIVMKLSVRLNVPTDILLFGQEKNSPTVELTDDEQELLTYYKVLNEKERGIVLGRAEQLADSHKITIKEPQNTILIDFYDLPVSAGTGVFLDDCAKFKIETEENALTSQADFALRISGDSMEPKFHDGDMVLVKEQPTVAPGEIGIFLVDGKGYIKQLGTNCLISLNPDYEDISLHEYDSVYCKGKVIGIV